MTREMSKNKNTFTAQRARFNRKKWTIAIIGLGILGGLGLTTQAATPESCFSFNNGTNNGTISYYFDTKPNCPSDVVIPEKIR